MNTDTSDEKIDLITSAIIGAAQEVSNRLGCGFLEKVYENSLAVELRRRGHIVRQQFAVAVRYKTEIVGQYVADLLVDDCVIVELKAMPMTERIHRAQCLNYLRATGLRFALLLNFGRPRLEVHRIVSGF
jgi:GxxExxY protein